MSLISVSNSLFVLAMWFLLAQLGPSLPLHPHILAQVPLLIWLAWWYEAMGLLPQVYVFSTKAEMWGAGQKQANKKIYLSLPERLKAEKIVILDCWMASTVAPKQAIKLLITQM